MLTNDAGHDVHVHITNYQDRYYGGAGMIRLYAFDLARDMIDVETFSPWFLARDPDAARRRWRPRPSSSPAPVDRFSLAIDFDARFAGFAPPVLPAPRPAARGDAARHRRVLALRQAGSTGQPAPRSRPARSPAT